MNKTLCFKNIGELVQVESSSPAKVRIRANCALVVRNGKILKVIPNTGIRDSNYSKVIDLQGRAVIPGLVDCHTHLIYAGQRKKEMIQRLAGMPYMDILKQGGGILSTVQDTRAASEESLYNSALQRMRRMMELGTTAFEIKSGYGLDLETEIKMLRVGQRLRATLKVPVTLTYLGAHAVPKNQKTESYLNFVIKNLPEFRGLADGVDIFCERGVFTPVDLRRLFLQAKLLGFQLRAHVEELSHNGGCFEAARLGALSCDHLEYATPGDIRAMKVSGTVAVLMPGVTLFLNGERHPAVHTMLDMGITIALATDSNPGSCPAYNMQTVLYLAVHLYRMTPEQAIAAATHGAAKALNQHKSYGGLLPSQQADFLVLKTNDYRDLFYYFGDNLVEKTYTGGKQVKAFKSPKID